MCIRSRHLDPKTRRSMVLGNLCLVIGLLLWDFHASIPIQRTWLDAVCGLLLGISIGVNLSAVRCARRCREKQI
ncbi:MAG: hypothetical protein P4K94_10580 [Terracidiphilus sp.]|jgi:hypothetical protein|nr:hypothetical protein [Terracidiphilus sp.]